MYKCFVESFFKDVCAWTYDATIDIKLKNENLLLSILIYLEKYVWLKRVVYIVGCENLLNFQLNNYLLNKTFLCRILSSFFAWSVWFCYYSTFVSTTYANLDESNLKTWILRMISKCHLKCLKPFVSFFYWLSSTLTHQISSQILRFYSVIIA